MYKRRFLHARLPKDIDTSKPFYLVEYDFKDPHDPRRTQFYNELRDLFRGPVKPHTTTRSVVIVGGSCRELAFKIKTLAIEHGGIANVYEAKLLEE